MSYEIAITKDGDEDPMAVVEIANDDTMEELARAIMTKAFEDKRKVRPLPQAPTQAKPTGFSEKPGL